jgi:hypothetical protein
MIGGAVVLAAGHRHELAAMEMGELDANVVHVIPFVHVLP